MRVFLVVFVGAILGYVEASAQQSVPVFKSVTDSLAFSRVQVMLSETRELLSKAEGRSRDSLVHQQQSLMAEQMKILSQGVLRFRYVFQPSAGMTSYEDLVRSGDPSRITTLTISGNNRRELPDSLFMCTNLEELELVNWKLDKLPRKLNRLTKLRQVTILNNQPTSQLKLSRNKAIKVLTIRGDDGNEKLPTKYRQFRNLETLDLARNYSTRFPNVRGCRHISKLQLTFNNLTLEDLRGRQPRSLMELNLSNNKISAVPASITSFHNVKKLNFNNNQVETVSDAIKSLYNLEEISFYKNKLKSIPEGIYSLPNLKVIDLYFNEIEKADVRIGQMASLEVLYLANNKIYSLPDNLGQLPRLRELYLHHNRISNLPQSVGSLQHLTVLRINNNSILEFPDFLFGLNKLQNLDLSHNQITTLNLEHFDYRELKILALVGNPWDDQTRSALPSFAQRLRSTYRTVVHLNTYTDELE